MTQPAQTHDPEAPVIAIRAKPPSPKRLSRKVLLAGALALGSVVALTLVIGLSERPSRAGQGAADNVQAASGPPESIRLAAPDYNAADLPRGQLENEDLDPSVLAPPLDPAWGGAPAAPPSPATAPAPDPEAIARAAPILFDGSSSSSPGAGERGNADDRLPTRLAPPRSPYELQAGAIIPAALLTGLNSDLPGRVIAQVTAPVFDSITGRHLLIPQGARLIGTYESGATYGDRRLLLVWNRLILPNGWSINLENMGGADPSGAAGLSDRTDNHLDRLAGAAVLSAIIGVAANESEDDDQQGFARSIGDAAAQEAARSGGRIVDRELSVHPTLRVRPGAPVRVLVTRDIRLRPYRM